MTDIFNMIIIALWVILPAYMANAGAVPFGGGTPIDFGKSAADGNRYFGDGKTWRGLIGGILVGFIGGCIQIWLAKQYNWNWLPEHTYITVFLLSSGALIGDLTKSYIKRRFNKDRGVKWPIADIYDMIIGSLVLLTIFAWSWTFENINIWILLIILILTPIIHRSANIIGYFMKLKQVPW